MRFSAFFSKNLLTKPARCDIIVKHSEKRVKTRADPVESLNKFKIFWEKYLTSSKNYGIIVKLSDTAALAKAGEGCWDETPAP